MKIVFWLQRNTGGMVIILMMSLLKAKWAIRSQAPKSVMIGYGEGSETKW
jgi:hypothetical protein